MKLSGDRNQQKGRNAPFLYPLLGEKMPAREEVFARILFLGGNSGNTGNSVDI